ncbi:MAG: hypothetical protein JEZ09_16260 [Salinivirgaceae bacterium]|nr:hypothetical protein [Salinivirgaceae bacterium]
MKRLKKYIVNFTTLVLAIVVLLSTSGFKIYSHHCNTSNTHNYSIIIPAENCSHHNEKTQAKSCCVVAEEQAAVSHCENSAEKKPCCTNIEQIVKLDTKSLLNHSTPTLKIVELEFSTNHFIVTNQNIINTNKKTNSYSNRKSPPPYSVPEYLSLIQVYII